MGDPLSPLDDDACGVVRCECGKGNRWAWGRTCYSCCRLAIDATPERLRTPEEKKPGHLRGGTNDHPGRPWRG